ncbi:MerR family transcriptional regulator [Mangrovicoccus algicola]|uniref:Helix-turn-helix domain-containing protein n=1 Tax=Mangrovicoccus algicola TaxID=2771008 RepID=A0A8J6YTW4_9RHOB|nr:helix-turn-helix domain-containing protein [Mangrovicoccus algicola]MBE3637447.1 helix-turn-helix domain-containing protein [Mangrovicoccus algicola]
MTETYRIGELARLTDTKVVTIRYYESIGLMPEPERSAANYRVYAKAHLDRLRFVRRCRDLGFSLEQVADLAALSSDRQQSCHDVDRLTRMHLAEVEAKIADLNALAAELRNIGAQCEGGTTISNCRILEALDRGRRSA